MMRRLAIALLCAAFCAGAVLWGAWLIAVPEGALQAALGKAQERSGLELHARNLRKGLFFSVRCEALDIGREGMRLVSVEDLRAHLDIPRLFTLRLVVPFSGTIAGGTLSGRAVAGLHERSAHAEVRGALIERTGLFELSGVRAAGAFDLDAEVSGAEGSLRAVTQGLAVEPATYAGMALPLGLLRTARLAANLKGDRLTIESFALEGEGLYARVTGEVRRDKQDLTLELMPDEAVMPDAVLSMALGRYRTARGHYTIPLKGKFGI